MNYLGHLYFSNNDPELMYANLFGDFVKGKQYQQYTQKIQKGITLHRTIDSYIDQHPAVLDLLHVLYEPLPKVAGIAVDLFFDHLLAKNWDSYHSKSFNSFLDEFHLYPINLNDYKNKAFENLIIRMREMKWMYHYDDLFFLEKASASISEKISFENLLIDAPEIFLQYENQINKAFVLFMDDALTYFESYYNDNL